MSRHSWLGWVDFLSRLSILGHDIVGQGKEKLCRNIIVHVVTELAKEGNSCHNIMFLCRDRVVQHGENLYHDRVFFVTIENLRT